MPLSNDLAHRVYRGCGLDPAGLTRWQGLLFLVALVLLLRGFRLSLGDVLTYGGVDFRNRVVGSRVLLEGHDPYTFVWQPGMPEELLDPICLARHTHLLIQR